MRKKIIYGLLLVIAFSIMIVFMCHISKFLAFVLLIGAVMIVFGYIVYCFETYETSEYDDYMESLEEERDL